MDEAKAGSHRSRWFALGYAFLAAGVVGVAVSRQPDLPNVVTLAFFVGLVVWAEHGAVLLPSKIRVSPGFMVIMASIAAFDGRGVVVGAAVIGFCSGNIVSLARARRYAAMVIDVSQYTLAAVVAAAAYGATESMPTVLRVGVTDLPPMTIPTA